jgi:thiamine biosynthesis lipoprotein
MGTEIRLLVGEALEPGAPAPAAAAQGVRAFLERFDARLSRFRPTSELSALNADPRAVVPASRLMRAMVRAALEAARHTDGLVDPTLVRALELAGYVATRDGVEPASLPEALASAPARAPARPDPFSGWRRIRVSDAAATVERPPGVRLDTGGAGKGLAADLAAQMLAGYRRFLVDCGGDIRCGGPATAAHPYWVEVEHPLSGARELKIPLGAGAVATSGIRTRIWRTGCGFHHHLLDPASGDPAWTGVLAATALAPTARQAETIAKAAFLSGPEGARAWLARHGGVFVRDDGETELIGLRTRRKPGVRFRMPDRRAA